MNKKLIWGVIVLAVIVILALVIKPSNNGTSMKVGVLMPFSENFAWWGEQIKDSLLVAQSNGYGKNLEFVYQDTKCNTKDAVSGTLAMKTKYPDMHIFIVGCDNDLKAMYPVLDKEKDLAFMVGLSGADLYAEGFPTINLAHRLEEEATAAAQFASSKLGAKKLGIITDNGNFGAVLKETAAGYFSSIGGSSVSESMKYNESSPDTSILKIVSEKPDAIYMQNDIPALSAILKRLNQVGYKGYRITYYGGHDQSLIDTAGQAAEGVYVPWVISPDTNPLRDEFVSSFKKMLGKDPFVTAYFVYDGMLLLDEADKSCKGNVRCIENYFYDKKDFIGTLGSVRYQAGGQVKRSFYMQQIKDGKFVDAN